MAEPMPETYNQEAMEIVKAASILAASIVSKCNTTSDAMEATKLALATSVGFVTQHYLALKSASLEGRLTGE